MGRDGIRPKIREPFFFSYVRDQLIADSAAHAQILVQGVQSPVHVLDAAMTGADVVSVSYPAFFADLDRLRA